MTAEPSTVDKPGEGLQGSDFELAAELYRVAVRLDRELSGEAIAAIFRRGLESDEAIFSLPGQRGSPHGPWQELFARVEQQRQPVYGGALAGDAPPDRLAMPLIVGGEILGFVGVAGRCGGYDGPAIRRFSDLGGLLAEALHTCGALRRVHSSDGLLCDFLALSDQPAAEDKLRLQARIFECNNQAVVVADADEKIVSSNEAFTRLTGYRESEVLGQSPALLLGEEGGSLRRAKICDEISADGEWCGELPCTRKSGEVFPAWVVIASAKDANGRPGSHVLVFSDISATKEAETRIHRLAYYDPLTALPNRNLFHSLLEKALSAAQRKRTHAALLSLDLNRFKHIVDSFGHTPADLILCEVSRRLALTLREEDIVARLGGDEFVIALTDISRREHAGHVARKVLAGLAEPFFLERHEILLSASIGISIFPEDGRDSEALLKNADVAMYRAKKRGSNAHLFYSQEMNQRSFEQLKLEGGLRRASERGEFHLVYQPQLDLASGRIAGAEALLRWHHPEHGLIPPAVFIPVAEETGLIIQIGDWVIDAACRQIRTWQDAGMPRIRVAVNLSARQFSASLPKRVVSLIARHAIPSDSLELEITESMLMHSADSVVAMMREFGDAGVLMTLDDFGTGYSSLSYLKRFPIDNLKIDQSFVRGIPGDQDDSAIARAIIGMAQSLRLSVIAEGVETAAQMEFLRGAGCEEVQGYYFSRPLPPDEFAELLWRTNR